jgi:hypothetical protein
MEKTPKTKRDQKRQNATAATLREKVDMISLSTHQHFIIPVDVRAQHCSIPHSNDSYNPEGTVLNDAVLELVGDLKEDIDQQNSG